MALETIMVWEFGLQGAVNKWVSIKKKDGYVRRSGSSSELDKSGRGHEGSAPNEHDADQNIKQSSSYKTKSKLRHKTRLRSSSKGSNSIESSAEELSSVNNSIQNGVSSHADSGKMVQEHKIDLPVSKQTFDEKHTNTSHHNRLDRAISQSDLLKRDAILPTNLRLQRPRSLGSTRHPQPPGFRGMDSSMHSVNSNLSVGSAGSALSGSIRSNHSIGSGSLSLQQINAMPWVNEGYDRAMKKREARYLKHNLPQPISNGGRSRDSSIGSTSDKQVSIRKNRLLNHMRDHYPQEYKHYNQSASSRQFAGKVPHSVVQSPTRTHYNDHTSSRSSHKLSPSNTPPLSMTLPLTEFTDDFDAKSGNDCKKCTKLVSKLQILEEELNYLKSYANDLESCDYCKSTSKSTQNFGGSSNEELQESASLKKASQRLSDATYRHKRQIEQMSRDRVSHFSILFLYEYPTLKLLIKYRLDGKMICT